MPMAIRGYAEPASRPSRSRPSRRTVVTALALAPVAVASGCTLSRTPTTEPADAPTGGGPTDKATKPTVTPTVVETNPDVALVVAARRTVVQLVAAYDATLRRHRRLRPTLATMLERHRRHADVLGGAVTDEPRGTTGSAPVPEPIQVPRRARLAVAALRVAEQNAQRTHLRHTRAAQSGALARVLASMAASEAQHVTLLAVDQGRRG